MLSELVSDLHFDYISSYENVTITDSRSLILDGCRAASSYGVNDIVITDIDGSLDPTGTSTGPSAFVSNFPHMTALFGDRCAAYANNCMAYCSDLCLRTVSFGVEQFGTENWKLKVTNDDGATVDISGKIQNGDYKFYSHGYRVRKFSASLPAGTYSVQFIDENGNLVWPTFVEELWDNAPDCAGSASPGDITILKSEVDAAACAELVRNGGQNASLSTSEPWFHTDPGLSVGVGLGIDGSDAIITQSRGGHWTGLGQVSVLLLSHETSLFLPQ